MKKGFISFAVLLIALVVCSNAGECKTVNNYYTLQPPQIAQNNSILYGKQNIPFYTVNHNNKNFIVSNNYHKKPPKYKKNNKITYNPYSYNYNPYGYNYNYNNGYYYNPYQNKTSILQRIFNL